MTQTKALSRASGVVKESKLTEQRLDGRGAARSETGEMRRWSTERMTVVAVWRWDWARRSCKADRAAIGESSDEILKIAGRQNSSKGG